MPEQTVSDLGRLVKKKYPEYNSIPNDQLGRLVRKKYPEYSTFVDPSPSTTQEQQPKNTVDKGPLYTVQDLGKAVKRKYPGAYDHIPDIALGRAQQKKYPGAYDNFVDVPPEIKYTVEDLGKARKKQFPGSYQGYSDADVGRALQKAYPGSYKDFIDTPPETTLQRAGTDLSIGFRGGVSHLEQTAANVAGALPFDAAKSASRRLHETSQKTAPTNAEIGSHQGLWDQVLQGAGQAGPAAVEYAPAIAAGKYAPVVAGAIGAAGAANKGWKAAAQEGVEQAANFYLMGKAAKLPTRARRAIGSAIYTAIPAAIESGGDVKKTAAAAITGGALGSIANKPETRPEVFKKITEGESVQSIKKSLQAALNPRSLSRQADETGRIATKHFAAQAQRAVIADRALRVARLQFESLPYDPKNPGGISDQSLDFIDHIETGRMDKIDLKMRPYAEVIRESFDDRLKRLQDHGLLETFRENYFPHIWNRPEKASEVFAIMGKRPLEGSKRFLRQRVLSTVREGLDYIKDNPESGLQLVSNNPIDIALMGLREQDKLLTARDILKEMKTNGLLKFVRSGQEKTEKPAGYSQIDDKVSTVMVKGTVVGHYYAPEGAVQIINNHLSPGMRDKPWFRTYLNAGNSLNKFQLGWSAFHAGMTTLDAGVSQFALAVMYGQQGIRTRNMAMLGKGLASAARIPTVPFEPLMKPFLRKNVLTNKIMEEGVKPGSHPDVEPLVQMLIKAGGRFEQDPFYRIDDASQIRKSGKAAKQLAVMSAKALFATDPKYRMGLWKQVKTTYQNASMLSSLFKIPGTVTENSMKWLFEYAVPMQKIGMFHRMAEFELGRLDPDATDADAETALQKAWASVDNRMGQLVYDNLFWNKTAKDLLMASVRSVGWNLGTVRELGGGIKDWGTFTQKVLNKQPAEFTHRMAYTIALPVLVGTIGGITNYLLTGQAPQSLEDYYYPRTGGFDQYGRPNRISFPSYMNDIFKVLPQKGGNYVTQVGKVLQGKIHPALTSIFEMVQNRDWRDQEIYNKDDPWMQQVLDTANYALKQVIPLGARYAQQNLKASDNRSALEKAKDVALPEIGITPAPAEINKRPYERVESQYLSDKLPRGSRTSSEVAKQDARTEMEKALRMGEEREFQRLLADGIQKGMFKESDEQKLRKSAGISPGVVRFNRLSLDQALMVYQYALKDDSVSAKDKELLRDILNRKLRKGWATIQALPEDSRLKIKVRNQLRVLNMLDENGDWIDQ